MDTESDRPQRDQHPTADASAMEQRTGCPSCGNAVSDPVMPSPPPVPQTSSEIMFCPKCGQQNLENNFRCTRCGFVLHDPAQPQYVVTDDSTLGGLIPYKNVQALLAYYLGVFSLIPCIGIPLGIAALVLGIKGLKYAKLHPEAKGKAHAWAGIILGTLCAVAYTLLTLIVASVSFMFG